MANFTTFERFIDFGDTSVSIYKELRALTKVVGKKCPVGALFLAELVDEDDKEKRQINVAGEGIVWTLVPDSSNDTVLWNFKIKAGGFATTTATAPKTVGPDVERNQKAAAFVDFALAPRRLEQGLEYLEEVGKDATDLENLNLFTTWVSDDAIKEEGWRLEELGTNEKDARKIVEVRARQYYVDRKNGADYAARR